MRAFDQELAQPFCRMRDRVRPGDADDVESVLARDLRERRLQRCAIFMGRLILAAYRRPLRRSML
jgi:hypothetical protein